MVCAPLRVCIVELQAGEKIVGEPQIGDSVRWNISPGMYGDGDQATQMIVLKPQEAGLDTNLLVATDRRAYYFGWFRNRRSTSPALPSGIRKKRTARSGSST